MACSSYSLSLFVREWVSDSLSHSSGSGDTRLLLIEEAVHDAVLGLGGRVVEDPATNSLSLDSLFFIFVSDVHDLVLTGELLALIDSQIVALQQSANAESDLCLTPVAPLEALLLNVLEVSGAILDKALDKPLILLLGPVVTLLHVEILEVQRAILKDNVLRVLLLQSLTHPYDVVSLVEVELVVSGAVLAIS